MIAEEGKVADFLQGGGNTGALMRAHNWSASPLGAPESWPHSLRSAIGLLLGSKSPMFVAWGDELRFLYNDAYAEILGAKHPGALGAKFREVWPEIWSNISPRIDAALAGEASYSEDLPLTVRRNGFDEQAWFTSSYSPMRDESARVAGMYATVVETTSTVLLRTALAEQANTLEILNRTGAALAAELDLERLVQRVTDAGLEITGAQFGAFFYNVMNEAGESLMLFTLSGAERSAFERFGKPRATAIFQPTFKGEGVIRSEDILADPRYGKNAPHKGMPKGHLPVRSYLAVPVNSRSGEVIGGLFFGHERPGIFTARHEALVTGIAGQAAIAVDNARLLQTTQRLNETLEARVVERTAERDRAWQLSQDLLVIAERDGTLAAVNNAWTQLLGWSQDELVGRNFVEFTHPDDREVTLAVFASVFEMPLIEPYEYRFLHKDGAYRWFAWTATYEAGRVYANGRHTTAEREQAAALAQAEEALRQAQKMEVVGQLTGGIAHDFNNLLGGIVGALDLMQTRMAQGRTENIERYAKAAMSSAQRAAALTHRLLAFSRRQPLDPKPVNANGLVASMEDLLRRTIGPLHALEIVTAGGLWTTLCDPNQLESAILNLAINARDAMPDGGKLTIETCNAHLDDAYVAAQRDVTPGQYICICITDTGTGMSPSVISRAFEPFFTTKPLGQGTGLGLSMVFGFAKQSEGHLKIYSEEGKGSTIKIYLPRYRGASDNEDLDELAGEVPRAEAGETVLIVEDEPVIRDLIVEILEDLGYRALEAPDGPAGLKILQSRERLDLLVTDVGLPGINGRQLADQARESRPDLKVLFITGYAENATLANGFLDHDMAMMTKPFAVDALAQKIRSMIEGD